MWERPVADVGLPGADKGQGAKYLFVGPGQEIPAGAEGYRVVHTRTLKNGFLPYYDRSWAMPDIERMK